MRWSRSPSVTELVASCSLLPAACFLQPASLQPCLQRALLTPTCLLVETHLPPPDYPCHVLEGTYGCDCAGCTCDGYFPPPLPAPPPPPPTNQVSYNTPGVGGWGGTCTCPDGQIYQVGDLNNGYASTPSSPCPPPHASSAPPCAPPCTLHASFAQPFVKCAAFIMFLQPASCSLLPAACFLA